VSLDGPEIDGRLSHASTLPARWYTDPEALRRENTALFRRTWQLAGRTAQVEEPGDYFTLEVVGEPLVVVRDSKAELHALSAVCRHRAGPVVRGSGHRPSFQCGYHGWTYDLDGRLLATPEFEGVEDFDRASVCLPAARVAAWGPFVFVNLDDQAPSLEAWMGELLSRTSALPLQHLRLVERREYLVGCNWKVYVDNYLEGYHIPIVHPGLFRELDYARYRTETFEQVSLQLAPLRRGGQDRVYTASPEQPGEALYFWVFPNLTLSFYPDHLSTTLVVPRGADQTLTVFEWFMAGGDRAGNREAVRRAVEFSDEIQKEDIAICEAVQKGLGSRFYERGRFSARRENGVHHFHRLLARFLSPPPDRGVGKGGLFPARQP
jgi:choline monooxygenase